MPQNISVDQLKNAGQDRLQDAATLQASRPDGACYLAGYGIECWLKVAILKGMGIKGTDKITDMDQREKFFRHRYAELRTAFEAYVPDEVKNAVKNLPPDVAAWDPQWRYNRRGKPAEYAAEFCKKATEVCAVIRRSC